MAAALACRAEGVVFTAGLGASHLFQMFHLLGLLVVLRLLYEQEILCLCAFISFLETSRHLQLAWFETRTVARPVRLKVPK